MLYKRGAKYNVFKNHTCILLGTFYGDLSNLQYKCRTLLLIMHASVEDLYCH